MADSQGSDEFSAEILRRLRARRPWSSFVIAEQIGEGGMSLVHRAHDGDLRRDVALKVLRDERGKPERSGSTQSLRIGRFIDEVQVTAQLDHPGIVPVYEAGLDERERPYFTMKLVRGDTLKQVFEAVRDSRDGWTVTRALGLLLKVSEAMSYAHAKNVVHRDLKPSNVMVGRFGEVFVMDWGLARVLDRPERRDIRIREPAATSQVDTDRHEFADSDPGSPLFTLDGDVVGTPAYMPPEQAFGHLERVGPQSDIYSLGAILYHLLTGQMPYVTPATRVDNYAIWRWVREGPPAPLEVLAAHQPEELRAICDKAMARELAQRYASMQEFGDELRAYLEGRVVRAHASGPWPELKKWIVRNKAVATLVAALMLALSAGGFGIAAKERERAQEVERTARAVFAADVVTRSNELGPIDPSHIANREAWLVEARAVVASRAECEVESLALISDELRAGRAREEQVEPDLDTLFAWRDAEQRVSSFRAALEQARARTEQDPALSDDALDVLPAEIEFWERRAEALSAGTTPRQLVRFGSEDARMRAGRQSMLFDNASILASGVVARVERELELARTLRERTLEAPDADRAWRQAQAVIEDPAQCPLYGGRTLSRQLGLVPLGANQADLWEFWHVLSGDKPVRGSDGRWMIGAETGVVLILMPGGSFEAGSSDASRPVELDWYFIAAHELTQGQWFRLTGDLPSEHATGTKYRAEARIDRRHPVEHVSWEECARVLPRVGLTLPTQAQWEQAARGGTSEPYVFGALAFALHGHANFGDRSWAELDPARDSTAALPPFDDGYAVHAPVGTFTPNPWGVYDALGNVAEWCRDWHASRGIPARTMPGDGELVPERSRTKVFCGGDYKSGANLLRVFSREQRAPSERDDYIGVRAARAVLP